MRLFRPFPSEAIASVLAGHAKVAVIDQNLAPGMGGITYPEIVTALYDKKNRPEKILSVIGGLGGKDMDDQDFRTIIETLDKSNMGKPLFLYDEEDAKNFDRLLKIAKLKEVSS